MSNDRFKQARRSLMNQQGQPRRPITPDFDDDADEATALVDINELRASAEMQQAAPSRPPAMQQRPQQPPVRRPSGPQPPVPQRQYNPHQPTPHHQAHAHGFLDETYEEDPHEATQMVDITAFKNAPPLQAPGRPSPQPAARPVSPQPGGMRIGAPAQPAYPSSQDDDATAYTNMNDFGQEPAYPQPSYPAAAPQPGGYPPMPGRHEGTQTLDLDDIQEVDDFDDGYTGQESTQFVDLNQLAAGAPTAGAFAAPAPGQQAGVMAPQQDPLLNQSYAFTPDAVQVYGNTTLIFARNQQGQDIVLKRIWQGHSAQMPDELRQKITVLGQMQHPHLARLNGVFDSHSGCWAELERPPGQRLSYMLQNGPQTRPDVALWAYPVADAIQYVHNFSILYANLTPDAVWIDEQTKTILLEPFDILAFEERGDLAPYGPPELQQPAGTYPITPATDVYCFAAVIVAALTATPDPNQVGLIEHQKLRGELVKALELNPALRPVEFAPILEAIGSRIDLNPEPKKGFDKRLIIPIVLIVGLLGFILFSGDSPPPKIEYRQEGLPEVIADREALAKAPGGVDEDEKIIVINSYQFNPPKEEDPSEQADVDISGHVAEVKERITKARKFAKEAEAENEYKEVMKLLKDIELAQDGELTEEQQEAYDMAMNDKRFREFRKSLIQNVEKKLLDSDDISNSRLSYQALSIDPHAQGLDFFSANKNAKVVKVKPAPPLPEEKKADTKTDDKEEKTP